MNIQETYIKRCIQLAKNGLPNAMPNPSVGAILVHKENCIAQGYTSAYGGAHAEVNCIAFAQKHSPELINKSTLYVSLEPCSHYGKTPPCADLIIRSGIKKVVIGSRDPFKKVAGSGIKKLKDAGIDVTVGILEKECRALNKRFFTFHLKERPYIILKWAQSKDRFIAPASKNKAEPIWITNAQSRQLVHKWRSEEQAILIGANTALMDNPSLTTRDWQGASPLRVVLDARDTLSKDLKVFNDEAQTLRLKTEEPKTICKCLYNKGIQSVIIEGGSKTLQRFIDSNLWDEARIFESPMIFSNGTISPSLSKNISLEQTRLLQNDCLHIYKNQSL